ncbi:hypothetical protein [Janthinobacterium sp. RT4P48]|uniref:hypothetical protein n=1 Tax=Janthinobacterium sp. RT4P48 TaxID=3424188 RepID=UPI003F2946A9
MRALSRMLGYRDVLALAPKMKTAQVYPQRPFHDHPSTMLFHGKCVAMPHYDAAPQ